MPSASAICGARASARSQAASASSARPWTSRVSARLACPAAIWGSSLTAVAWARAASASRPFCLRRLPRLVYARACPGLWAIACSAAAIASSRRPSLAQHRAQVGERVGVVRPRCQGSPDQVCGRRVVAEPVLDEAEMVQRLGMVRLDGQHPAQRRGSLGRLAGAQMLGGGAKLTRQSRISGADRCRSLVLLRGPPLLPVHRSWPRPLGSEA